MRIVLRTMFAMLAIASFAFGADNTLGTWKYNTAKSTQARGISPITALTTTWEAASGGVKITAKGARADGSKIDTVILAKYDGKEVPVAGTGLPYDTVAFTQVDANKLTAERTKKRTKYHGTVQIVISADGKTMTQTTTGIGADDKTLAATAVYDKQ
jgi:hypothetical protein